MDLPKYTNTNKKGRSGLNILTKIVENELGWIVRPNHQEDDFGIDGFLDVVIDGFVTGKSIAIQIKSGNSYLNGLNDYCWNFTGETRHLNYYLNHDIPVLIILVDLESEIAYWEVCKFEYVNLNEKSWNIPIPKNQQICSSQKSELLTHVPKTIDYVSQFQEYLKGNELLSKNDLLCILVGKEDVLNMNYQPLIDLLTRICSNKHHLLKFRENIEIGIHGYDDNLKELFQIPETSKWITEIFNNVPGLSYFLANNKHSQFLNLFIFSTVDILKSDRGLKPSKIFVEYESKDLKKVFDTLFNDLNSFTKAFKISDEINEQISRNIGNCVAGSADYPSKNN